MKTKKALDSQRLKSLFPETPPAFTAFVERNLNDLKAGKETPKVKKKLSLALVLAIVLTLILAAVAVAAMLSPTADIFGFLYGQEKKELLLKGDIATLGQVHTSGDLEVTLEDVIYQADGDMTGLYGTGIIAAKEGSNLVLIPEEYSPASPTGFALHYGQEEEEVPQEALTYLETAQKNKAKLLRVRLRHEGLLINGQAMDVDVGYNHIALPDGRIRFTFEMRGPGFLRSTEYHLKMNLGWFELDEQGEPKDSIQKDSWDVNVIPQLTETAKADIAAKTPLPVPTETPPAAPGSILMVGNHWAQHERYMAAHPERSASDIRLQYGEWYNFIANPENVWDVGFFFLQDGDLDALIKAGMIEDLSQNETIMAQVSQLYPRVQEALMREGKTYALPHAVFPGNNPLVAMNRDKWETLGLDFNKLPKTFKELTELAVKYMNIPRADRRGTRFLSDGDTAAASRRILLSELVNLAFAEAMAKGDPTAIDTPAFREGLLQIKTAYKALSQKQAATDAKGSVYGLIWDGGQTFMDSFGNVQLNLRLGETPAFTQRLGIAVVNVNAPNKDAALQYMEWLAGNLYAQFLPELNAQVTAEEIAKRALEQNILLNQEKSFIAAGISQEELDHVEELKARLKKGDYGDDGPGEAALARYREKVAPRLTIMSVPYPVTYDQQRDYLSGKLSADQFIKALQDAAQADKK